MSGRLAWQRRAGVLEEAWGADAAALHACARFAQARLVGAAPVVQVAELNAVVLPPAHGASGVGSGRRLEQSQKITTRAWVADSEWCLASGQGFDQPVDPSCLAAVRQVEEFGEDREQIATCPPARFLSCMR